MTTGPGELVDEVSNEEVDLDGVPGRREVAGILQDDKRRPGQLG